jgi:predicted ATP-dependent endonuclease of OLD family
MCRVLELQIILTTHSPYILEELPPEARAYILTSGNQKQIVFGVSPDFAMTKMDDESHPECDLYVEDDRAKLMLQEIIVNLAPDLMERIRIIPFGSASVGQALGQMVNNKKFPNPSLVFLDGDQAASPGCIILPGGDAPERVIFEALKKKQWTLLDTTVARDFSSLSDACMKAMTSSDHHEWVQLASSKIHIASDTLWQAMCAQWVGNCLSRDEADKIINPIKETLALAT